MYTFVKKEGLMEEKLIGKVTHYYGKINVGIIELSDSLKVNDTIHIKGHASDFSQQVPHMEIEHVELSEAKAGDMVGIKVDQKVHPNDEVYKVIG
jgi:putative protease